MTKNTHKDRAVDTVFLHIGITIGHKSSQSFTSREMNGYKVEMVTTPIGVYVYHPKTGDEHLIPYSNIHNVKYVKEESKE